MRERNREINRRRRRYQKRLKLRKKLEAATTDNDKRDLEARIKKTFPRGMA
jgi:hypothetical protein